MLLSSEDAMGVADTMVLLEECLTEMKKGDQEKLTITLLSYNETNTIVPCEDYSSLRNFLPGDSLCIEVHQTCQKV